MHKIECQKLAKVEQSLLNDDMVAFFLRILIRIKNKEANMGDEKGCKTFNTLMDRKREYLKALNWLCDNFKT